MKRAFSIHYRKALLACLKQGAGASPRVANRLGVEALAVGITPPALARLHENILLTHALPGLPHRKRAALIRQAGTFFASVVTPLGTTPRGARASALHLHRIVATLSRRTVELAASKLHLEQEVSHRKAVAVTLQKSTHQHSRLLQQSHRQQELLRHLSRQLLSAQEDERKRISRELHDVIAQTLTGINLRLLTLKKEAALNTKSINRNIGHTQRLVEQSVSIVQQFARELRPAVLDDLGLSPALHTFLKTYSIRTGIRARLTAPPGLDDVDAASRTALFRVAQEALVNVARHARASRVDLVIRKEPPVLIMTIHNDGKAFDVQRILSARRGRSLGLLGMKERLEMVGGRFDIASTAGKGTTVTAEVPLGRVVRRKNGPS